MLYPRESIRADLADAPRRQEMQDRDRRVTYLGFTWYWNTPGYTVPVRNSSWETASQSRTTHVTHGFHKQDGAVGARGARETQASLWLG